MAVRHALPATAPQAGGRQRAHDRRKQAQSPHPRALPPVTLLDEGRWLCSLRTMYRILDDNGQVRERRDQLRHPLVALFHLCSREPLLRPVLVDQLDNLFFRSLFYKVTKILLAAAVPILRQQYVGFRHPVKIWIVDEPVEKLRISVRGQPANQSVRDIDLKVDAIRMRVLNFHIAKLFESCNQHPTDVGLPSFVRLARAKRLRQIH